MDDLPPPAVMKAAIQAERKRREVEASKERCQTLAGFVREAWHVLEPDTQYVHSWHIDAICSHLEEVTYGNINRLLINVPPGSSKSLITSVMWPAWEWSLGLRSLRYLTTSYNEKPVTRDTRKSRDLIMSDWYQARWPEVKLTRFGETSFANKDTGTREGVPFGSLTSQRGDRLIIDDPHSVETAESDAERERTTRKFREGATNRLNDQKRSAIVIIMQRLHEEDISGVVIDNSMGYVHLCLPMEYDPVRGAPNAIGYEDPRVEAGELLDPVRFSASVVKDLKRDLGSFGYAGQYQQEPTARGGGILKRDWWQLWDNDEAKLMGIAPDNDDIPNYPRFEFILASLDTAFTAKTENDPSAMTVWGIWLDARRRRRVMLMYAWAERLEFPDLVKKVYDTCKKRKVHRLIIEAKASGISVGQALRRTYTDEEWSVQLINPGSLDKIARAHRISPIFEQEIVYAPNTAWAESVITECANFPRGKHDDLMDSTSQAIAFLRDNGMLTLGGEYSDPNEFEPQRVKIEPLYPGMRAA